MPTRMIGLEVLLRIEAGRGVQELVHGLGALRAHQQRVAVGRRCAAASVPMLPPAPGLLSTKKLWPSALPRVLGEKASGDVGALPGLIGDDDAHGLAGIGLRRGGSAPAAATGARRPFHRFIVSLLLSMSADRRHAVGRTTAPSRPASDGRVVAAQSARISSACSLRRGGRRRAARARRSFTGMPGARWPSCSISISRCAACGCDSACGTVLTGPAGTPFRISSSQSSAALKPSSVRSISARSAARCCRRAGWSAKRGSVGQLGAADLLAEAAELAVVDDAEEQLAVAAA